MNIFFMYLTYMFVGMLLIGILGSMIGTFGIYIAAKVSAKTKRNRRQFKNQYMKYFDENIKNPEDIL